MKKNILFTLVLVASNAEQIDSVRLYLEEKLSELSVDKRNFFSQFYGITPSIKNN